MLWSLAALDREGRTLVSLGMGILVQRGGKQLGPLTLAGIRTNLQHGRLRPEDLARSEWANDWAPLATVLGGGGPLTSRHVDPPSGTGGALAALLLAIASMVLWAGAGFSVLDLLTMPGFLRLRSPSSRLRPKAKN